MQNSLDAARSAEKLTIGIAWRQTPERVTLIWTDNGSGLPAEVADRLFDPYFSTKSKGTGLGLAICRNLTDRMGGTITLSNRSDGPGAIAELTLPRLPGAGSVERDPELS
jgi:C4-dicarboxylate-specific signal transduction histidine kinase